MTSPGPRREFCCRTRNDRACPWDRGLISSRLAGYCEEYVRMSWPWPDSKATFECDASGEELNRLQNAFTLQQTATARPPPPQFPDQRIQQPLHAVVPPPYFPSRDLPLFNEHGHHPMPSAHGFQFQNMAMYPFLARQHAQFTQPCPTINTFARCMSAPQPVPQNMWQQNTSFGHGNVQHMFRPMTSQRSNGIQPFGEEWHGERGQETRRGHAASSSRKHNGRKMRNSSGGFTCQQQPPTARQKGHGSATFQQATPKEDRSQASESADLELARQEVAKLGASLPGDSPGDVKKWIAERRAKWPSRDNVERKKQEQAARVERGEVDLRRPQPTLREQVTGKKPGECSRMGKKRPRNMTGGEVDVQRAKKNRINSSDGGANCSVPCSSALGALAAQYAGDSGDDDATDAEEGQIVEAKTPAKPESDPASSVKPGRKPRRGKKQRKRRGDRDVHPHPCQNKVTPSKPTLLRKLLEPEIREEHNILLQCIRVIVNKNFYIGGKFATEDSIASSPAAERTARVRTDIAAVSNDHSAE